MAEVNEMEKKEYKRLKYVIYISLFIGYSVYFYNRKSFTTLIPTLHKSVGLQESELGAISSSFALSYGLSKFICGVLSDKLPARELFLFGLFGTGLCNAFFTVCRRVDMFVLIWFVNGLFQGLSWPPCSKLLKEWFRPNEIGTYWSLLTVGCNLTSGICPLISIYLATTYGWQMAMLLPSSIALSIAPLIYATLHNSPREAGLTDVKISTTETPKKDLKTKWSKLLLLLLRSPFLWVLIQGYFLTNLLKSAISDWIQLYLIQDKNHSLSTAGIAISCFEIGGMAGSIVAGVITDQWMQKHDHSKSNSPRMPIFIWLYLVFLISIHFLRSSVDATSSTLFIGLLLFGCGMALSGSISMYGLIAMENGPPGFSGTSHAVVALASNLGAVLAGFPLATFGKAYGWNQTFLLLQILGAVNFFTHIFTCNLDKQMVDISKLQ